MRNPIVKLAAVAAMTAFVTNAASAASMQFCTSYAEGAVQDFLIAQKWVKCQKKVDGRWHVNRSKHFQWCRSVPYQKANVEKKIRQDHLIACGAVVPLSEGGMNAVDE